MKSRCARSPGLLRQPTESDPDLRRAEALHSRALRLTSRGKYGEAAAVFRRAISFADRHSHSSPLLLAAILNDFGVLSKYAGRFERAKRLYERARKVLPPDDPRSKQFRATLYHNLAGLEHARGQHARALVYARDGIQLRRKLPRSDGWPLEADQAALAAILVELGSLPEAEKIQLRLLRVYRHRFGAAHHETASLLSNLGALYVREGRLDAAERMLRRAARDLEGALGKNHPRLASVLNNLANLCARRGNLSEADALYARALRLLERQLAPTYPRIALVRANRDKVVRARVSQGDCLPSRRSVPTRDINTIGFPQRGLVTEAR
jgi:tetratricopeptide (TPR) repeat protein